jgi:hypothetical protein
MTAFSKYAAQTQRQYLEQFKRDAQEMYDCWLVPIDNLLSAPMSDLEMGPLCHAFMHWSAAVCRTKPGEGPNCLTCDTEFGPGRTVPAAFWFQLPYARLPTVIAIDAVCPTCFKRSDCFDRIALLRRNLSRESREQS